MPPKFKRHLNDDEVTGSVKSERVSALLQRAGAERGVAGLGAHGRAALAGSPRAAAAFIRGAQQPGAP